MPEKIKATELVSIAENFVYSEEITEKFIKGLAKKYEVLPDASTTEGYDALRKGIAEVRTARTSATKHADSIKKPLNGVLKQVNAKVKEVTEKLMAIEQPMKDAKKVIDDQKAAEKAERERKKAEAIMAMEKRVQAEIRSLPVKAVGKSPDEIHDILVVAQCVDPKDYEGRELSAETAQNEAVTALESMYEQAVEAAKAEAIRLEQERIRKKKEAEAAEIARIAQEKLDKERAEFELEKAKLEEEKAKLAAEQEPEEEPEEEVPTPEPEEFISDEALGVPTPKEQDIEKLSAMLQAGLSATEIYEEIIDGHFQTIGEVKNA